MKRAAFLSDEELIRKAAKILAEKLGEVEASRFFAMPQKARVESVLRHRRWQKTLDKDAFFQDAFQDQ